ncbi:MAG: VOC family protein [Rhodothermales bacterium]|nr:VOC family protein [Rhodothermales bacterium]
MRTVVYVVPDLDAAKQWYQDAFAIKPYFDQPFYVGFDVNGYELGLDPDTSIIKPGQGGSVVYWKVNDIQSVYNHMLAIGAESLSPIENVGVLAATVVDPFGNLIGLIEEPATQP